MVTGAGPVVDTVSTATTSTLQGPTLSQVPKPVGMQDILSMAAGVALAGAPDVGDSSLAVEIGAGTSTERDRKKTINYLLTAPRRMSRSRSARPRCEKSWAPLHDSGRKI